MLKSLCAIFHFECLSIWRHPQDWLYPTVFFLIVMLLFPLCLTTDAMLLKKLLPGLYWIAALLAGFLKTQTLFLNTTKDAFITQWRVSPLPLPLIILVTFTAHWLSLLLPLLILMMPLSFLFGISLSMVAVLATTLIVGTPLLILIGGLCAALTVSMQQQGTLLGLLMMPLLIPMLIFAIIIVEQAGFNLNIAAPLALLTGMTLLAILLIPFVIAYAIRNA